MKEKAIDKLRDEMASETKNPGVAVLGEIMTEKLLSQPEIAGKILTEGKTLAGAFEQIRTYARTIAKNGCAYVDDQKAMAILCAYYGIAAPDLETPSARHAIPHAEKQADSALDLDRLLGM